MKSKFFKHRTILSEICLFLGLGFVWFFIIMNPWQGFINSDDSIPFQHVIEPWRLQDLYYWGTSRMGMLYEVFWKLGATLLLGSPQNQIGSPGLTTGFYLVHSLFMFAAFPFWLATFKQRWSKLVFLLFFLPITHAFSSYFLLPGQPYGVLFFLHGVVLWVLNRGALNNTRAIALGALVGMLWIQHELSGFIALAMSISANPMLLCDRKKKAVWNFWITLIPIWIICYSFKPLSGRWALHSHYPINDFKTFMMVNWFTIRDGQWWFSIKRLTGHIFTIAIFTLFYEAVRMRKRSKEMILDPQWMTFFTCMLGVVLIHLSRWYITNHQSPRYYSNLIPLLVWVFLSMAEKIKKLNFKKGILILAAVAPIYTVQSFDQWMNPIARAKVWTTIPPAHELFQHDFEFCPQGWGEEECKVNKSRIMFARVEALKKSGCRGYIDDYWNSHILAVMSNGEILTSAGNHVRNPELFAKILAARPLCVMPREEQLLKYTKDLNCKPTPYGFLICKST